MNDEPIEFEPNETPLGDELAGDNYAAQYDDDPNPYHGDYFENDGE